MDERWLREYESAAIEMFNGKDYPDVGFVSFAAAHMIGADSLELSWFPTPCNGFEQS